MGDVCSNLFYRQGMHSEKSREQPHLEREGSAWGLSCHPVQNYKPPVSRVGIGSRTQSEWMLLKLNLPLQRERRKDDKVGKNPTGVNNCKREPSNQDCLALEGTAGG